MKIFKLNINRRVSNNHDVIVGRIAIIFQNITRTNTNVTKISL